MLYESELKQVLGKLQEAVGYQNPDEKVFGGDHVFLGDASGFWFVLHGGSVCISHPEWLMASAKELSQFLSAESFPNSLNERCYCHYPFILDGEQPPCVIADVVGRQPYSDGEDYRPPVRVHELMRLGYLLERYSSADNSQVS